MAKSARRIFKPGAKDWFLAASFALIVLAVLLYIMFYIIPYQAIFIFVNFFFLYVGMVYILEYLEKKSTPSNGIYPSVTVLVPAYNSEKTIAKCLNAIKAMDYPSKFEIIALVDGSTDNTAKIAKTIPGIKVWEHPKNLGKAASLNIGIKKVRTEIVVTIDSDTYPDPDSLKKMMLKFHEKNVGAVIPIVRVSRPENFLQRLQEVEYYVFNGFSHTVFASLDSLFVTPGPMSAYRTSALREVGGFDEDNVAEDTEIALNFREHGYKIIMEPSASAYTEVPKSFRGLIRQRLRWFRGAIYNGKKYFHMLFNPKYGNFGKFVYPVTFIMQGVAIVSIARMLQLYLESILGLALVVLQVIPISWNVAAELVLTRVFNLQSFAIFMVATTVLWAYTVYSSFEIVREPVRKRHIIPILVYMTIYPLLMTGIYFVSFIYEIANKDVTW